MKKVIVCVCLVLLFSVSFVSAECIDSDGADNYIVKGTTTGIHDPTTGIVETVTDFCSDDWVNEYGCGMEIGFPEDVIVGTSAKCSYGCEDGACIINPESGKAFREIVKCVDSDGKENFDESGYITLTYDDDYVETLNDNCGYSSGGGLYGARDYFCSSQGYSYAIKPCERCSDGICTNKTEGECFCEGYNDWSYDGICEPDDCELCPDCLKIIKVDDTTATWGIENSGGLPTTLKLIDVNRDTQKARFQREWDSTQVYDEWFSEDDCLVEGNVYCRVIIKDIVHQNGYADIILESPSTKDEISLRWEKRITISPDEEEGPINIPEEEGVFYDCNGCELDNKCYPMGYRRSGKYCSDNYEFVNQIEEGMCDNNFECKSNVCVSGECVGESLLKKIIAWFKKMFGGGEEEDAKLPRTEEVFENCPLLESAFAQEFELKPEEIEKGLKYGTLPWACKNDPSMGEALKRGCEWDNECCLDLPKIKNIESAQDFVKKFFYCYRMEYMGLGPGAPPGPVKSVNVTTSDVRKLKYGYFMHIVPYDVTIRESTAEFITGSGSSDLEEAWLYLSNSGCLLPCPTEEEEEEVIPEHQNCIDSDGGRDYYVKGVVLGKYHVNAGGEITVSDTAFGEGDECCNLCDFTENINEGIYLREGYCDEEGVARFKKYECPDGCQEGVCV